MTHSRTPVALVANEELGERLLARAVRTETGCLEWTGSRDIHNYGWIRLRDKIVKSHRASFAAFVRSVEAGETICHTCDNPPCLEPSHLFAGTMLDNTRDMIAKGRRRPDVGYVKGQGHHQAKLTDADVLRLRAMRAEGATYSVLMKEFGLSKTNVGDICNRKIWKNLP